MKWFYIFVGAPYFSGSRHAYKVLRVDWEDPYVPASEMEILDTASRWIHCPLCERLTIGEGFRELRDIDGKVVQEEVFCEYCSMEERREGETKTHAGYKTWCEISVYTTRPGYILGSPRLMKAYAAARRFKAPRKRT